MAGLYTEVVDIVIPRPALVAGDTVVVQVPIKNIWTSQLQVFCYCVSAYPHSTIVIYYLNIWLQPKQTATFSGQFTMPDFNTELQAFSLYRAVDGHIYTDDSKKKAVPLFSVPSAFSGLQVAKYNG